MENFKKSEELEKASRLLGEPYLKERIEEEGICVIPEDSFYDNNNVFIKDGKRYKKTPYGNILCKNTKEVIQNLQEKQSGIVILQHDKCEDISGRFFHLNNLPDWLKRNKKLSLSYTQEPIIILDPIKQY